MPASAVITALAGIFTRSGLLCWGGKDALWEKGANQPVGRVHNFAQLQIHSYTAQHIRVGAREMVGVLQIVNHMTYCLASGLHQVGPDAIGGIIARRIRALGQRAGGEELRLWHLNMLAYAQANRGAHTRFNSCSADLSNFPSRLALAGG